MEYRYNTITTDVHLEGNKNRIYLVEEFDFFGTLAIFISFDYDS